jgi:hypothetical protein
MNSINLSFAVPDKLRDRYGNIWADLDFIVKPMNLDIFKKRPMETIVGTLLIAGSKIKIEYKDLFNLETKLNNLLNTVYSAKDREIGYNVDIKGMSFQLRQHEITRLYETIVDAKITVRRKYELGV